MKDIDLFEVNEAFAVVAMAALRDCDGSREKAAEVLGISATTLWRKMTRLGIVYDARDHAHSHARG